MPGLLRKCSAPPHASFTPAIRAGAVTRRRLLQKCSTPSCVILMARFTNHSSSGNSSFVRQLLTGSLCAIPLRSSQTRDIQIFLGRYAKVVTPQSVSRLHQPKPQSWRPRARGTRGSPSTTIEVLASWRAKRCTDIMRRSPADMVAFTAGRCADANAVPLIFNTLLIDSAHG